MTTTYNPEFMQLVKSDAENHLVTRGFELFPLIALYSVTCQTLSMMFGCKVINCHGEAIGSGQGLNSHTYALLELLARYTLIALSSNDAGALIPKR